MKKDLEYYKNNAKEDYALVPISVLRYISELEKAQKQGQKFPLDNVSVSSFVDSVAGKAVYINGKHYSNELREMSIPVVEYNELKQLAEDWDKSNSR